MKFSLVIPLAPDRTAPIIESIKKINYPKTEFHVVVVRGKNPSANRNKGAENAKGEIIGFLDDDAIVDENILKNTDEFFEKHPEVDIVGGPQLTPKDETGFAKISGYALGSKFGAWKLASRYGGYKEECNADECNLTSANLFVRKKVLDRVKFDTQLFPGEDPKFIDDSRKAGFIVSFSPSIIVYHKRRKNAGGLIKQIFSYGKTRPMKESFFKTIKNPFFLIPSIFLVYVLFILGRVLYSPRITGGVIDLTNSINNGSWIIYPLIFYIILCLVFGIHDSIKNKDYKSILILPFIYPLIHLSYGAGMIYGYIGKINSGST